MQCTPWRYDRVSLRNGQPLDGNLVKVLGYTSRGYRNEGWDCTYRRDGRITDFDLQANAGGPEADEILGESGPAC